MSKTYFCLTCGTSLTHTRKGLKNRGEIVNLIALHECDEDNLHNITDSEKPTRRTARTAPEDLDKEENIVDNAFNKFDLGTGDKRDKKDLHPSANVPQTSSAPPIAKQMIKDESNTSEPKGDLGDL